MGAAPHVAGVIALLLEQYPQLTPPMVKKMLLYAAKHGPVIDSNGCGRLLLNVNFTLFAACYERECDFSEPVATVRMPCWSEEMKGEKDMTIQEIANIPETPLEPKENKNKKE